MPEQLNIPRTLRARREALGMSQRALAEALGTKQPRISALEGGTHRAGPALLDRWTAALGLRVKLCLIDETGAGCDRCART